MTDERSRSTRERVLRSAQDRFIRQGYADTSLAEIASDVGTTKAALYYHFPSKAEVLEALLETPLATLTALASFADTRPDPAELISRFVDAMAGSCRIIVDLAGDPAVLREHGARHNVPDLERRLILALAPDDSATGRMRATAALSAARGAVASLPAPVGKPMKVKITRSALAALQSG